MSELSFASAGEEDIPVVAGILTDAIKQKLNHGDLAWGENGWSNEEVHDAMTESTMYLIKRGSEIVGTVSLQWDDERSWGEQPPVAGYMHRLAIKDGYYGQGLGGQAIDWATSQVAKEGRQFLRLDCEASNTELCAYYEKQGFKQVGTRPIPEYEGYVAALYEKPV